MDTNEQDDVIVDTEEATNEEVTETTEETVEDKAEAKHETKPKRTPQEEYDYHVGKAKRLAKKLGLETETKESAPTEKPTELDYGQLALLRTEGIKGSGELALVKEVMAETGKSVLEVMDSNYFKSRLTEHREAQASADAIPKGKNRSGQTGVTDIDLAVAQYRDTGKLPDDFKTRSAVVKKIAEAESMEGVFSGPSVVGPQMGQF